MRGSSFLKVAGMLMIIGGSLGLLLSVIVFMELNTMSAAGLSLPLEIISLVLVIVSSAIELAAGLFGVKYCDNPKKAKTCIAMGVLVILTCIASSVITVTKSVIVDWGSIAINLLIGLILPLIYLIGAVKNKHSV